MTENPLHVWEAVAKEKAGIEGWEPFEWDNIFPGIMTLRGGIPRKITRGPRKGENTWKKEDQKDGKFVTVAVTKHEVDQWLVDRMSIAVQDFSEEARIKIAQQLYMFADMLYLGAPSVVSGGVTIQKGEGSIITIKSDLVLKLPYEPG